MSKLTPHPSKFNDEIIKLMAKEVMGVGKILDPFAGTCKIGDLRDHGYTGKIHCVEIEEVWAEYGVEDPKIDVIHVGNCLNMDWAEDGAYDAICTSPCWGTRMADHHEATDDSVRNTYRHKLGRKLSEGSSAGLQWGNDYRKLHAKAWEECYRVLKVGGIFLLDVSDHIRKGELMKVSDWHSNMLTSLGLTFETRHVIHPKRLKQGQNYDVRASEQYLYVFYKLPEKRR